MASLSRRRIKQHRRSVKALRLSRFVFHNALTVDIIDVSKKEDFKILFFLRKNRFNSIIFFNFKNSEFSFRIFFMRSGSEEKLKWFRSACTGSFSQLILMRKGKSLFRQYLNQFKLISTFYRIEGVK
jgi:hypothetical protein